MTDAIRLLHVDDDPEFTELTAEFIGREFDAFDTVQAVDAEEGLAVLDEQPVDCIVSDYKLPGMDGIEFLEAVRANHPELPFIIFTGKGSEAVASEAISAGATDYFRKERIQNQYDLLANRVMNAVSASEARQRVRERTREYRMLVEKTPVPLLVVGEDHQIRYVNHHAVDTFGAEEEADLIGKDVSTFVPAEDTAAHDRLDAAIDDREPAEFTEHEFLDIEGNTRHGRGSVVPVTFGGRPAIQVVISDITERKRQERRVKRHQEQITQLHEIGVEVAGCESKQEVYELMVDAAESILDLDLCIVDSVEDGQLVARATSSGLTEYEEAPVEEAGIAGKAYRTGESYLVNDSDDHPAADPVGEFESAITVPIEDFGVFQATATDSDSFDERDIELLELLVGHVREALVRLDQEKRLREQRDRLRRENERLDQFASIVSHDIRNPLNVAQLRLDLARDEVDSDHLGAVADSIDRIETLTEDLLSLARMGETITDSAPVDLEGVVSGCWDNVDTADATLSVVEGTRIEADETRLQQLVENLFRNAVEHGGKDVTVRVGLLSGGDGFYVEDDGEGMSPEARERAFDTDFSTRDEGTGFGLAIVSRIAEAHGWCVTATAGDDGGARFEFRGVETV
ncbi:PAS domain S-box-containing protein [Halovenus aranensis]|uniref:histidine kinase n=1 Tax=Halovenus aranensis TaxID=890420 RepID=A0A1G8TV06_9EURY|nr:response regulator [Halovenus aranensis]SDJ44560.1 PAS domain S-box-containing protein [Halovenus aranensis]